MLFTPPSTLDPSRQARIDHAGRISRLAFEVVIGLFAGIAVVMFIMRLALRIFTRRKLYLDDYVLLFGLTCLAAATYLVYSFSHLIFLSNAVRLDPSVFPTLSETTKLIDSLKIIDSFLALIWTTTFAVKLSFLIFFKQLIERVSKNITIYYWVVVVFTVLTWMFLVSEAFILCPYFGFETLKCLPESPHDLTLALTTLITLLDIITDFLVISIPILVLRKTQIKLQQKLVLGVFLCLSFVMVVCALTRISAYRLRGVIDLTWQIFWQHVEGSVALMMASITTFRTAFVAVGAKRKQKKEPIPSYTIRQRLLAKLKKSADLEGLPSVPGATLTGVRTFIYRNNRPEEETTVMGSKSDRFSEDDRKGSETESQMDARSDTLHSRQKSNSSQDSTQHGSTWV